MRRENSNHESSSPRRSPSTAKAGKSGRKKISVAWWLLIAFSSMALVTGGINVFDNITRIGFKGTFRTLIGQDKEVWFSLRTDGQTGSGAEMDPYDVGCGTTTPGLACDTIKAGKLTTYITTLQTNHIYHLPATATGAANDYCVLGWFFNTRRTSWDNCVWIGAGRAQTRIRLVGAHDATADGVIFGSDQSVRTDGFELHHMTLNDDATAQPKWTGAGGTVGGLSIRGTNNTIEDVDFIGWGTKTAGVECFPAYTTNYIITSGDFSNNLFIDCHATTSVTGNADGVTVFANGLIPAGATGTNNRVVRCRVDMPSGTGFTYSHAFHAAHIWDSTAKGVTDGVYSEPISGQNYTTQLDINNCWFYSCTRGIGFLAHDGSYTTKVGGASVVNCWFIDTQFPIAASGSAGGGYGSGGAGIYFQNFTMMGCHMVNSDNSLTDQATGRPVFILAAEQVKITNNDFDSSHSQAIYVYSNSAYVAENKTRAGNLVTYFQNNVATKQRQYTTGDTSVTFTPSAPGWYRIINGSGDVGGIVRLSDQYDGHVDDIELSFNIPGYGNPGSIQQYRHSLYAGNNISQVRISSNNASGVYLDVYVASATTPGPITVATFGPNIPVSAVVTAPVVGAVTGGTSEKMLALGLGFRTTSDNYVGNNLIGGGTSTAHLYSFTADNGFYGYGGGIFGISSLNVGVPSRVVTGSTTSILATDGFIYHNTIPGGGVTDTLPTGAAGLNYVILDTAHIAGTNNITVTTSGGQTFTSGGTSKVIATDDKGIRVQWTGTKWYASAYTGL